MHKNILFFLLLVLWLTNLTVFAESPFVVIMYDSKTENVLGAFPPKRTVWAKTIDKVNECGAKAVVLKFFYDLPKDEDVVLASSIKNISTLLQACINENEPSNNELPTKFAMIPDKKYNNLISGRNGWLPVRELSNNAYDIGFVDIRDINEIPIIEKYNDLYVKSLYFCILQYVFPGLQLGNNTLIYDNRRIKLNKFSEMHVNYPNEDTLEYLSLCDVLNDRFEKNVFEDKIVIIGWDGNNSETFTTPAGKVNIHRVFIYGLYDMYEQIIKKESD